MADREDTARRNRFNHDSPAESAQASDGGWSVTRRKIGQLEENPVSLRNRFHPGRCTTRCLQREWERFQPRVLEDLN
jgi:hypothetical protein